jgi:hypothetical protein
MQQQNGGTDTQSLLTLSKVKVQQFTATPSTIGPFGESILRWSVTGPSVGWTLQLNGNAVANAGSLLVQPPTSTAYFLTARAGQYTRPLSNVSVAVDASTCDVIIGPLNPVHQIASWVKGLTLSNDPSLYFRDDPSVSFLPGRIHIEVKLGKPVKDFPDPEIDATLEFGLDITNGLLVSTNPYVNASVSEPWYVYLGGIAFLGLWIALSDAQNKAQVGFEHLVQGLPEAMSIEYPASPGKQYKSVAIVPGSTDNPIQITECAIPPIRPGQVATAGELAM